MTTITKLEIDGVDRKADHTGSITISRRINAVGDMRFQLDNTDGTYDDLLSCEHQLVRLELDGGDFWYGHVHNVDSVGRDAGDRWEKLVEVTAWDQAEELTFKDGFEKVYHDHDQTLDDILEDVFNGEAGLTWNHVIYRQGTCPDVAVGFFEKKEGTSLLTFLQELHRSVDCLFYVDDSGYLRSKSLGLLVDSNVLLNRGRLIGEVRLRRQSADKLYNWVKVIGRNPQFDAWTEDSADDWTGQDCTITDETTLVAPFIHSKHAVRATRSGAPHNFNLVLDIYNGGSGRYNYTYLDLSKGTFGCWIYQHGGDEDRPFIFFLTDRSDNQIWYWGDATNTLIDHWSWVEASLGTGPNTGNVGNRWSSIPAMQDFDWGNVKSIAVGSQSTTAVDYFVLDGLTIPVPAVAIAAEGGYGTANERRELVVPRSDLRSQKALQRAADTLLLQHKDPRVDALKGVFAGDTGLRYAGLLFTADFPMGVSGLQFYASQVTHTVAPYLDAGKGWDHVMEVEGVYVSQRAYDHIRLGPGSYGYSVPGVGLKEK